MKHSQSVPVIHRVVVEWQGVTYVVSTSQPIGYLSGILYRVPCHSLSNVDKAERPPWVNLVRLLRDVQWLTSTRLRASSWHKWLEQDAKTCNASSQYLMRCRPRTRRSVSFLLALHAPLISPFQRLLGRLWKPSWRTSSVSN
jgi:hypothetical protein